MQAEDDIVRFQFFLLFFAILCRYLPREVDPLVYNMSHEDPGNISYSEVGGLSEQIRELREVIFIFMSNDNTEITKLTCLVVAMVDLKTTVSQVLDLC